MLTGVAVHPSELATELQLGLAGGGDEERDAHVDGDGDPTAVCGPETVTYKGTNLLYNCRRRNALTQTTA